MLPFPGAVSNVWKNVIARWNATAARLFALPDQDAGLPTALTTLVGLVPLAMADPTVAGVYIDSLPMAVCGGLTTSTIFTLLGLPVWYTAVEDFGSFLSRFLPRRVSPPAREPPGANVLETINAENGHSKEHSAQRETGVRSKPDQANSRLAPVVGLA